MNDKELHELLTHCGAEIRRGAVDPLRFVAQEEEGKAKQLRIRRAVALALSSENAYHSKRFFPMSISLGIGMGALGAVCLLVFSLSSHQTAHKDLDSLAFNAPDSVQEEAIDFEIGDAYAALQSAVQTDDEAMSANGAGVGEPEAESPQYEDEGENLPEYVSLAVESPNLFYEEESEHDTESFDS